MVAVVAIVPVAHEASDGRLVVRAPAGTDRLEVTVSGTAQRVRLLSRQTQDGRVLITVQVSAVARTGADVGIVARSRSSRVLGRTVVRDVHLLGPAAFSRPRATAASVSTPASAEAREIAKSAGGRVGISVQCLGTRRRALANGDHVAVAASTLKLAILAAALARDVGSPTRSQVYATYRAAIVHSSNAAANDVLATVGGGSTGLGARRTNALMARLGLRSSFLDGPYRLSGGPSLKRTSAADLERLAEAVYRAARNGGALPRLGVSRHEARVLIGLMASETYPGLIRDHVAPPVAHKAGWLSSVQNDVALIFGGPGGTCLVGITTEGLSFGAASAIGRAVAQRVLPLLAAPRKSRSAPRRPTRKRRRSPVGLLRESHMPTNASRAPGDRDRRRPSATRRCRRPGGSGTARTA